MDDLFLLPSCPIAMPRAYWLGGFLTSALMLIQPNENDFNQIERRIETAGSDTFDMDIVNNLYGESALILPHRPYILLSGEFRSKSHNAYLGNNFELWNATAAFEAAKYLHFSDWPLPKVCIYPNQIDSVVEDFQFVSCSIVALDQCQRRSRRKTPAYV